MERGLFERSLAHARMMERLEGPMGTAEYWSGFAQGLRRRFFGEAFGTQEQHELLYAENNGPDLCRAALGRGYRVGFEGNLPIR